MKKNTTNSAKLNLDKEVISHLESANADVRLAMETGTGGTSGTGGQTTLYCFISQLVAKR
jgi:hypothetical protein